MAKLLEICDMINDKIRLNNCINDSLRKSYVSTENMLSNKAGITSLSSAPISGSATVYNVDDVLVSNIRPYFKKIWKATSDGICSNDVLVFRAKKHITPDFVYYILANDSFFDYSMKTSKGTKMPRGDKQAILEYVVPDLDYHTQQRVTLPLRRIDDKIALNSAINCNLYMLMSLIFLWLIRLFRRPSVWGAKNLLCSVNGISPRS